MRLSLTRPLRKDLPKRGPFLKGELEKLGEYHNNRIKNKGEIMMSENYEMFAQFTKEVVMQTTKEIRIGKGRGECSRITIEHPFNESKAIFMIDGVGMYLILLFTNGLNEIESDPNVFYLDLFSYPQKTVTVYDVFQKFELDFEETIDRCDLNIND